MGAQRGDAQTGCDQLVLALGVSGDTIGAISGLEAGYRAGSARGPAVAQMTLGV
jgi:hypothetical protein